MANKKEKLLRFSDVRSCLSDAMVDYLMDPESDPLEKSTTIVFTASVLDEIRKLPDMSIDISNLDCRKLATWVKRECSECGFYAKYYEYNYFKYCPNCGAKMYFPSCSDEDDLK